MTRALTWTAAMDDHLRRRVPAVGCEVVGNALGISKEMVRRRAKELGIPMSKRTQHRHAPKPGRMIFPGGGDPLPSAGTSEIEQAILAIRRRGDVIYRIKTGTWLLNHRTELTATEVIARPAEAAERDRLARAA